MISCTEALNLRHQYEIEVERQKQENTNKCIERTKEWCHNELSKMISEGASRGNRRVTIAVSDDPCYIREASYTLKCEGYVRYRRGDILHIPTIIRIAKDHGFTVRFKEEDFYMEKKVYNHGKEYYIEWA